MVPCTWEPQAGCSPHTSLKGWAERSNPCLNLQAILCLGQPRGLVATLAKMAHCWFVANFVSSRTPRALFGRCFALSVPGLSWCLRLLLAKSRTLHYPLLSFIPAQPIYPDSKDPSEWWNNHLLLINNSSHFCIQDLKENSGATAQPTEMFPSIPKPTRPASSGSCLSEDTTTLLSQTQILVPSR